MIFVHKYMCVKSIIYLFCLRAHVHVCILNIMYITWNFARLIQSKEVRDGK